MTHVAVSEWGKIPVSEAPGEAAGFSRAQANALFQAARARPLGGADGASPIAPVAFLHSSVTFCFIRMSISTGSIQSAP